MICLTISHHVFLTENQRYSLVNKQVVKTLGVSLPVWLKSNGESSEPATEVFCWYDIFPEGSDTIEVTSDGYKIFLSDESKIALSNLSDNGSAYVTFPYKSKINLHNQFFDALHFITLLDTKFLTETLC